MGVEGVPAPGSVWRVPGMGWLLGSAMLWFAGFALLVPVAPLWVIRGGSDDLGAGLVTGVMMAGTVLAQLSMRRVLPGLGWRWTLVLGGGLLGLPALGHLATDRLWPVIAALVVITAAGGAILTFTSHILASPALGFGGLLAFTGAAAVSRWGAGGIADRFGATPAIAPLLFTGALGLAAIGLRADSVHDSTGRVLVIAGLLVVGVAYGGLQNLTLTQAFAVAGEPARDSVSIAWNLSFDAGTGLGAFAVGAIATATSYSVAFAVLALAAGLVGGWWAVRA
jgi:hypothetical protein